MTGRQMLAILIGTVVLCLVVMAFIVMTTKPAASHQAAAGWWYDQECCGGQHCEQLTFDSVENTANGWRVRYFSRRGFAVDTIVPHGKERPSRDGWPHGCASATESVPGFRFYCLYVPSNV